MKWKDLPKEQGYFTKRSAVMVDLDKNKIVQYYSANTKIVVVQKCVTPEKTYYRTRPAAEKGLNWVFEASVFGLPNEKAPSVHNRNVFTIKPVLSQAEETKQKSSQKPNASNDGERHKASIFSKLKRFFKR